MDILSDIRQPITSELEQYRSLFERTLTHADTLLGSVLEHIRSRRGKMMRPILVLLVAKAQGGVNESALRAAVTLELLHTASLVHDDVVDESDERRGQQSVNAGYGNKAAVLVGDYLLSTALIRSIQTGDMRIVGIISSLGRDLSEGEIKQLETADESVMDEACYMQVIHKKTASLLSACAEIGAISAQASAEIVAICRDFGQSLGYAFQIKDDIFDYFKEANIGKPTGNDIREGKVTLPLLYALREGDREEADRFRAIIRSKDFTDANVEALIRFAKANGGIAYAESRMRTFRDEAVAKLSLLPQSAAREALMMLADFVVERTR